MNDKTIVSIPDSVIITQPVPIKQNYKDNCAFYYSQKSYFGGYQSVIMTGDYSGYDFFLLVILLYSGYRSKTLQQDKTSQMQ